MKIAANHYTGDGVNGSHNYSARFPGFAEWIKIWNPHRTNPQLYATTIHELAHASHFKMDKSTFRDLDTDQGEKLKESWARGVQWDLTRMVYPDYRAPSGPLPKYTLVVVDMIDPNYPSDSFNDNLTNGLWNDNVTGYTIQQIEDALNGKKTWNGWRDNIKNRYSNGTKNNLDALFAHWN